MIVIIGAGITGLTAAANLPPGRDWVILEKENYTGGLATQYFSNGYWFDFGGHYFHFQGKPEIKDYLLRFCTFREYPRKSKTFLLDRYIPFPLQFHLSYLPAPVRNLIVKEILQGGQGQPANLRDFLLTHFGGALVDLFFEPFLSKYYQVDLTTLAAGMERGSIPVPDKEQVLRGYKGDKFAITGYNPVFYYPSASMRHFFRQYTMGLDPNRLRFAGEVLEIDYLKREVKTREQTYAFDKLITTMPLKRLLEIIKPAESFPSPRELSHITTLIVNVVLERKRKQFHWVYLPEPKFPFYRMGFYPGHTPPVCYLERTVPPDFVPDREALLRETEFTLNELKVIRSRKEILHLDARVIPVSYILFKKNWKTVVPPLLEKLRTYNIYSIGRFGSWNYTSMSDDVKSALELIAGF